MPRGGKLALAGHEDEVIALYQETGSLVEIATKFGVTREQVRSVIRKAGVERKRPISPPREPEPCACGCGGLAKRGRRFVSGHNKRAKAAPKAPKRPPGTTLTRPEQRRRDAVLEEARAIVLEPPGPSDTCTYRPARFGFGGSPFEMRACGLPTVARGAKRCDLHQSTARDTGVGSTIAHSPEAVAMTLAEEILQRCGRCGAAWAATAGEAAERFREHQGVCSARVAAA